MPLESSYNTGAKYEIKETNKYQRGSEYQQVSRRSQLASESLVAEPRTRAQPIAGSRPKRALGVLAAIEWTFWVEKAQLELPPQQGADERSHGFGAEYVLMQRTILGCKVEALRRLRFFQVRIHCRLIRNQFLGDDVKSLKARIVIHDNFRPLYRQINGLLESLYPCECHSKPTITQPKPICVQRVS